MIFRIDLKIFIFMILFYFTRQIEIYSLIMIFCIIHELGHLLMGLILKMKPEKIELMPYGLSISFKLDVDDYNKKIKKANLLAVKKIVVAIAGPITNIILMLIFMKWPINIVSNENVVYSNLLIALFNLIPVYPLDGGRIVKEIIHIFLGREKSKTYMYNISYITMIVITAIASILILIYKNIAIFFIIIFLWILIYKENIK